VTAPRLLAISPGTAHRSGPDGVLAWCDDLAGLSAADALQVREKELSDRALWHLTRRCRERLRGPRLLVNGRADVAIAAHADGLHLPSRGVPAGAVRRLLDRPTGDAPGARRLLGCSTHTRDEVRAARAAGADYVTFGPVFATPGKARYGDPAGLDGLARAVEAADGLPVLALGGIEPDRLPAVAGAGASGIAGIRVFRDAASRAELLDAARAVFASPRDPVDASAPRPERHAS
jgi:thiamine-phosphate pyrophosphorylase